MKRHEGYVLLLVGRKPLFFRNIQERHVFVSDYWICSCARSDISSNEQVTVKKVSFCFDEWVRCARWCVQTRMFMTHSSFWYSVFTDYRLCIFDGLLIAVYSRNSTLAPYIHFNKLHMPTLISSHGMRLFDMRAQHLVTYAGKILMRRIKTRDNSNIIQPCA